MHGDVLRVLEAQAREVGDLLTLGGAEHESLARLGEVLHEGVDGRLEAHVHDAVRLVENEDLEIVGVKAGGLVQVLEHAAWCADQDVHPRQPLRLLLEALAADDQPRREGMFPADLAQDLEDLDGELASGGDDEGAEAVELGPLCAVQLVQHGDEERKGLSAAGLGGAENVVVVKGEGDGSGLDVGAGGEVGGLEAGGGGLGEGEVGKGLGFRRLGILRNELGSVVA